MPSLHRMLRRALLTHKRLTTRPTPQIKRRRIRMIMSRSQRRHELLRCRLNRSPFPALFDWEKGAREVEGNFCASLWLVFGWEEDE